MLNPRPPCCVQQKGQQVPYTVALKASDCRMHADECGKAARVLEQGARRTLLLAIVRTWHTLANQIDRFHALPNGR
jgi:hypothetical protein